MNLNTSFMWLQLEGEVHMYKSFEQLYMYIVCVIEYVQICLNSLSR